MPGTLDNIDIIDNIDNIDDIDNIYYIEKLRLRNKFLFKFKLGIISDNLLPFLIVFFRLTNGRFACQ